MKCKPVPWAKADSQLAWRIRMIAIGAPLRVHRVGGAAARALGACGILDSRKLDIDIDIYRNSG
jgi:hypothetical protein